MLSITNKKGIERTVNDAKTIKIFEEYLKIERENNYDSVVDLMGISNIKIDENEYIVYTGEQYDAEMKVDYEDFCDMSDSVIYEHLDENDPWSAEKYKEKPFVVCNSMLEIFSINS